MLVLGVGLLVMNQSKTDKMMKQLTCKATQIANMFKGKNQNCECATNNECCSE